jgi:hypothetical protein
VGPIIEAEAKVKLKTTHTILDVHV